MNFCIAYGNMSESCEDCGSRDDEFLNEDSVVYHFTCPARVNSILREGLRLGSPPVINEKNGGLFIF